MSSLPATLEKYRYKGLMSYLRMDCSTQSEGRKDIFGSCSGTVLTADLARPSLSCPSNLSLTVGLSRKYSLGV